MNIPYIDSIIQLLLILFIIFLIYKKKSCFTNNELLTNELDNHIIDNINEISTLLKNNLANISTRVNYIYSHSTSTNLDITDTFDIYSKTINMFTNNINIQDYMSIDGNFTLYNKKIDDYLTDTIYPIGSFYTQYPSANSNDRIITFPENETPEKLFGGSWLELFNDDSIYFRTEGELNKTEPRDTNGIQDYAMKHITDLLPNMQVDYDSIDTILPTGVFSIHSKPKIGTENGRGNDIGVKFHFDSSKASKSSENECRVRNRLFKIWKKISYKNPPITNNRYDGPYQEYEFNQLQDLNTSNQQEAFNYCNTDTACVGVTREADGKYKKSTQLPLKKVVLPHVGLPLYDEDEEMSWYNPPPPKSGKSSYYKINKLNSDFKYSKEYIGVAFGNDTNIIQDNNKQNITFTTLAAAQSACNEMSSCMGITKINNVYTLRNTNKLITTSNASSYQKINIINQINPIDIKTYYTEEIPKSSGDQRLNTTSYTFIEEALNVCIENPECSGVSYDGNVASLYKNYSIRTSTNINSRTYLKL
jgi:hypothetical protein